MEENADNETNSRCGKQQVKSEDLHKINCHENTEKDQKATGKQCQGPEGEPDKSTVNENGLINETASDFYQHVGTMVVGSFVTLGMALGSRLGLFELMAAFDEPKTSLEIAEAGGFKERYVREWLGVMATGDIVELDQSGEKYFIPAHRHEVLTDPSQLAVLSWALPIIAGAEDDVFKCFQKEGPRGIPYSRYPMFHEWRDQRTLNQAEWGVLQQKLDLVPNLLAKLENGAKVCDMGTSTGRVPLSMAERFPHSAIWGLDCSEEAITMAKKLADEKALPNVTFQEQDICAMPEDWTDKWDFVSMFDVAHDVARTSCMMREVLRTLKPGGHFLVVDNPLHSKHKDNIDNPIAPMIYAMSLFHCMPVSLNEDGGEGLGAAWGQELACQMLTDAGFVDVKVALAKGTDMTITCQKPET